MLSFVVCASVSFSSFFRRSVSRRPSFSCSEARISSSDLTRLCTIPSSSSRFQTLPAPCARALAARYASLSSSSGPVRTPPKYCRILFSAFFFRAKPSSILSLRRYSMFLYPSVMKIVRRISVLLSVLAFRRSQNSPWAIMAICLNCLSSMPSRSLSAVLTFVSPSTGGFPSS